MSLVKSKDSKPEMIIRKFIHGMGYRYRLHSKKLPGKPDIVFTSRKKVIFIHGCFWHRHKGCKLARLPKSRIDFWLPKLEGNKERDFKNQNELKKLGWDYLIIWECEIKILEKVKKRIIQFLSEKEKRQS